MHDATFNLANLKEYYLKNNPRDMVEQENPTQSRIGRIENAGGNNIHHAVIASAGASISASFARAQAQAALTSARMYQFDVPFKTSHCVASLDAEFLEKCRNKDGAWLSATTLIVDSYLHAFTNDTSTKLFRSGSGAIGRISSGTTLSSSTLELANSDDVYNFVEGMALELSDTETGGSVKAKGSNGNPLFVLKVNHTAGTLTIGTLPNTSGTTSAINDATRGVPTAAAGDYIYRAGDYDSCFFGFESWIPVTVASDDDFCGVNRSNDRVNLAGLSYAGTDGRALKSVLEAAMGAGARIGGKYTDVVLNPIRFAQLSEELGNSVMVDVKSETGRIGFRALEVAGLGGIVKVTADRSCPINRAWIVNLDDWEFVATRPVVPDVWAEDKLEWLRMSDAAALEIRLMKCFNLICHEPRNQVNVQLPDAA